MNALSGPSTVDTPYEVVSAWRSALVAGVALLSVVAAISAISPMNGEDYGLARPLDRLTDTSVLGWILDRSVCQILGWNARLGEQLAIVWLALGKSAFVAANTACFAAFAVLLAWYGRGAAGFDRSLAVSGLFAGAASLLVCPRLELFFWETAAAGYLQPLVLILIVLLPFFLPDIRRRLAASRFWVASFALLALPAGASFENVGPAVVLIMIGAIVGVWSEDRRTSLRLIAVAAAFTVGWGLLMLAPSTAVRAQYYRGLLQAPPLSFGYLVRRSLNVGRVVVETSGVLLVLAAALVAVATPRDREVVAVFPRKYWGFAIAATLSVVALVFSSYTEPRALAFWWVSMLALGARAFEILRQRLGRRAELGAVGLALVALIFGAWLLGEYAAFARQVEAREARILEAKASGQCGPGLAISLITTSTNPRFLNNREEWVGESLGQIGAYYGCTLTLTSAKPPD